MTKEPDFAGAFEVIGGHLPEFVAWLNERSGNLDQGHKNLFDNLLEECGELAVSRSKLRRFGSFSEGEDGRSNVQALRDEAMDIMFYLDLLVALGFIDIEEYDQHALRKGCRLHSVEPHFFSDLNLDPPPAPDPESE